MFDNLKNFLKSETILPAERSFLMESDGLVNTKLITKPMVTRIINDYAYEVYSETKNGRVCNRYVKEPALS